jgi:hypothetical protein
MATYASPKSVMVVKESPKKMMLERKPIYFNDTYASQTTKDPHQRWRPKASKESFPKVKQRGNYNTQSVLVPETAKPILKLRYSMIMFMWKKRNVLGSAQWTRTKASWNSSPETEKEEQRIDGEEKLTDALIDKLQNYYGVTIRSNCGNLGGMKAAFYASIFHCASSKKRNLHTWCSDDLDSWSMPL